MRIVKKPWGHEEIWAETDVYVGKMLHISAGSRLSLQYHNKKTETIRVIQGHLLLTLQPHGSDTETRVLQPGETFHVSPGTVHRFGAGEESVVLVEVSTTELDDVVRIEDDYVR